MANGGSIKYSVGFNVDKTGLNQMKASLQELLNLTKQDLIKINGKATDAELDKIKKSAKEVESALERAFNPNLGTLNVSKFNQELKKLDVNRIYRDFSMAGQAGRNAFRNITSDILTTNMQLKQTHTLLDNMATTMANTIKWGVASSIMNTFTGSVQQAYGYVKNLDSSLNDIRIVTNKSADEMAKFAIQANKAAKELGASTTSYTDASLIYYQQGLTDAEVAARAEVTLKAANVTGQSADAVSEQLTAVWNGYKVSAEEAEFYIDKLAAVAATTASDLEELSVGMSKVASAANLMGVDVDQLNAQLATIVSVTRQAPESVGTALKTIYARMGDIEAGLDGETSLDNYTEKMAQMGYDVLDANGKLRDMGEVIEEIGNNWKNMSREQQISLSQTVAGTRQYNNLLALFDNWDMYTKAIETSSNAAGTLQEQQDIYMDRTVAHLQQLRTATEDLYDSLFETKSFNNLLDGITGAVDLLGNFADAIGGGGNALLLLGTIGTQVFSKHIASGLATTIMNFQTAKENATQLSAEMEILNQFDNTNIDDSRTQRLIEMKRQQLDLTKSLTIEERNISNEFIKQQNELYKEQDALQSRLSSAEELYARVSGNTIDLSTKSARDSFAGINGDKGTIDIEIDAMESLQQGIRDTDVAYQDLHRTLIQINRGKAQSADLDDVAFDNLKNQMDAAIDFSNLKQANEKDQRALNIAIDEYNKITNNGTNIQKTNSKHIEAMGAVQIAYKNAVNHTTEALKRTKQEILSYDKSVENNQVHIETLTQRWNNFIKTINLRNNIQQFTTLLGKIGQITSGIRILSQVTEIWNNQDLSTGEKILQLTTSLTMGLPMLINGVVGTIDIFNKLNTTFKNTALLSQLVNNIHFKSIAISKAKTAQDAIALVLEQAGIKLTKEEIKNLDIHNARKIIKDKLSKKEIQNNVAIQASTKLNIIAREQENISLAKTIALKLKDLALTAGPYLLAIGAVAGAVWLTVKAYNAEADAAEKAREKQQELAESYKETKQAYDDLKSSLDKYENAKKSLDEMVEGTREWRDAVQEVNSQVLDLIQKYPELASAVENSNGVLSLNEDAYQQVLDTKFNQAQSQYRASLQGTNVANDAKITADAVKTARELNKIIQQDNSTSSYAAVSGASTYGSPTTQQGYIQESTSAATVTGEQLAKVIDLTLQDSSLLGDENNFINAVTSAGVASEEVAKALFDSQSDWKELSTQIAANNEINKNLAQNKYSSYLSTNKELQENDTYKAYQGLVTSILASKELNDTTVKSTATSKIAELSKADKRAQYQELTGVSDEELADTNIKEITEFLIQEEVTRLIAENADGILADIQQLTKSENGKNVATFLQSGVNGFSPEQITELEGLSEQSLTGLYDHYQDIFKEKGYADAEAFVKAFQKGLEEYDPKIYWENQLTQIRAELEDFGSSISTLISGGELSDDQNKALDELESKYTDLAAIQDRSSSAYLERLIQIREALEEEQILAEQAIENAKIDELADIKISADTNEFEEALVEIAEQDYEVLVAVKADVQSDFDAVTGVMSEMEEMASKIGDNFIVAASDLEELNDAFPGILNGIKYLNDGTVQLSQESVKAAMDAAEAEVAADTQKTIQKFENQKKELEGKRDAARAIANIAHKIVQGEATAADSQAQITQALNTLKSESSAEVSEQEQKDGINVAEQAAVSSASMADNYGRAYQSMAEDSAKFAEIAQANLKAAEGKGSVVSASGYTFNSFSANSDFGTVATSDKADLTQYNNFEDNAINWEDVATYYDNLANSYDEALNNIIGKQAELLGASTDFAKKASNISKGHGSDGSKSEKDKMDLIKDKVDIYHDLNLEIKNLSNEMNKLGKQEKKLFGRDLIDNLNEQLSILQHQTEAYQDKIDLAKKEASMYRSNLASQGITFDSDGNVSNYIAAMQGKQNYLNSLISKYNSMSETEQKNFKSTIEQAKKDYDQFQKDMEYYENLMSETIPGLEEEIQDALDKQIEIQIQKFTMEVEIRLDMAEAERDWNEFKKKVIDDIDEDDILGNAMAKMLDFSSYYKDNGKGVVEVLTRQVNDTLEQLRQIDETGTSSVYGDNKSQAMEDLQTYYTELMSQLEDVHDLVDEIRESYLDMIDEANEKFDEQIDRYETISDLIEHNMSVIELLNGDDAYDSMDKYYKMQEQNNLKQLDFHRQEVDFWKEKMEAEEEGSEAWEAYRENWQAAVTDLNEAVEKSVEDLIAKYQNTVNSIFDDLNSKLTDGKGLDYIGEEWDLINKNADQYLDTVNSIFAVQELENKYLDALDNTDSISAQNKLNDLMNEQLEMLREKEKLTQYDVDRANALYEIALKEIALQDAQQSKSQMRLRRDAQGNYSYQFVSDQDAIGQAEDELAAAQNSLYNMDKDQYRANLDEIYEVYVEFQEKLNELYLDNTLSDIEREEQKKLLVEQYGELINGLVEQNEDIRLNLQESALMELAEFQDTILMEELIPQWDSGVQAMTDKFAGEGGFIPTCQDSLIELDEATKDYEGSLEDLEDTAGISFDEIEDGLDTNIDLTYEFIDANDELINKYDEQIGAIQNVQDELDYLISKYDSAKQAAEAATEAAYKYWQIQQELAAGYQGSVPGYSRGGGGDYSGGGYGGSSGNGSGSGSGKGSGSDGSGGGSGKYSGYYFVKTGDGRDGQKFTVKDNNGKTVALSISYSEVQKRFPGIPRMGEFNTGGYTGEWTNGDRDGRLAFLHQKELVLNSEDTENILSAVNVVRSIGGLLSSLKTSMNNRIAGLTSKFSRGNDVSNNGMTIEQKVSIEAKFEGQTESSQIETALMNLVNYASQHAYDTKR